ncbi:MAG: 2-amino-4-hydroxy-6-hydroxymethyldihydropteridine diphosphokinase [Candidatus Omnitrophota bacterium]|jgi:2-amino-4-hydroxy-6-hydroxymethyldihydropteridine diphosphokinase
MTVCYLGLGSNLGDRSRNIKAALDHLNRTKGIKIEKISRIYETESQGGPPQGKYLNAAVRADISLPPGSLLKRLKKIEKDMGRKKGPRWGPREIDLDILFYGDKRIKRKGLTIPHPRIFEREFVLRPLKEVL